MLAMTSLLEINIEKKIEGKKDSGDITKNNLYNLVNFISLPPHFTIPHKPCGIVKFRIFCV